MKKRTSIVLITAVVIIFGALALFYLNKDVFNGTKSPQQIYSKSRNSVFLVEYNCSGELSFYNQSVNYTYDPTQDGITVYSYTSQDESNRSFNVTYPFVGTAFAANGKIYSAAHVVENCTPDGFDQNIRDYLSFWYGYSTPSFIENLTKGEIKTEYILDYAKQFLNEINKSYKTDLTVELVSNGISDNIVDYFINYGGVNLTNQTMTLSQSSKLVNDSFTARIIDIGSVWPGKDYAILETNKHFPDLIFGDSDRLEIGEEIYVIGFPGVAQISVQSMLEPSITSGIISSVKTSEYGEKYFQIDAAIYGGNSGGPVFNKKGEVIGILIAGTYQTQGFNFFLPSNSIPK